jgi:hypothetical protein
MSVFKQLVADLGLSEYASETALDCSPSWIGKSMPVDARQ